MSSTKRLKLPSHWDAVALWLLTVLLGSILTTITAARFILGSFDINAIVRAGILCTLAAVVLSAPALVVLPLGIRWALAASTACYRTRRLLLLISSLFGVAVLLGITFITGPGLLKSGVLWFAACYFPVAIGVAYVVYAKWIFTAQQ